MGETHRYKKWLFALIMGMLFLPLIQSVVPLFETESYEVEYGVQKPKLNIRNWFSGKFQKKQSKYIKHSVPFRMELVRLSNQLYYSLFHQGRSNSVVVGREGTLLLEQQIQSLQGLDFIGTDSIAKQVSKLEYVRDCLEKHGIKLQIALVPSKATYHKSLIPEWLKVAHPKKSNYEEYVDQWKKRKISFFNAVPWLLNNKEKKHRMFPKNGLHYSKYGQYVLMDSLSRYLAQETSMRLPALELESIEQRSRVDADEKDLAGYLTIFSDLQDAPLSYPKITVNSGTETAQVLTIGDSYFMGICNSSYHRGLFNQGSFWYYNREIRTQPYKIDGYVNQINLLEEVEKHNIVLLFASDANCHRFSFNFIDNLYRAYKAERIDRINFYTEQIKADDAWTESIRNKAAANGLSLEEAIRKDAEYLYEIEP